jgi:hypothetical protein
MTMKNQPQDPPGVVFYRGCLARLGNADGGVKAVGLGLKSLVALLELSEPASPEVSDQLRAQLRDTALRLSRRLLVECQTAHKQLHTQVGALSALTVVGCGEEAQEEPHEASAAAAVPKLTEEASHD